MASRQLFTISGTSPAAPGTAILGAPVTGLAAFGQLMIDAALIGATGGTLDVYIQRQVALTGEVAGGVWADWLHFTQLTAGNAAVKYSAQAGAGSGTVVAVGNGTDASGGTPALAAGSFLGGHPGDAIRVVCVAGTGTTAGAALTIYVNGRQTP